MKKPENQNQRMGQFVKGMTAEKKKQPNNLIPYQKNTIMVVI